jgi:hypothetical protein
VPAKRPNNQNVAPSAGSQASDLDCRSPQVGCQNSPRVETKDVRLPAAAIQPRYDLHEGPLGTARVEIGDAKGDAGG